MITSGRASKITAISPIGHETFFKIKLSSSSVSVNILFIGSSNFITSFMPEIISIILLSSNLSLLNIERDIFLLFKSSLAFSKSLLFASNISLFLFSIFFAISERA